MNEPIVPSIPVQDVKSPDTEPQNQPQAPDTPPKKEDMLSPRFAALARKEKAAFKKLEAAKQYEQALKDRETRLKEMESWFDKAKQDPEEALKKMGWSYQDLTNYYLNNKQVTPDVQVKAVEEKFNSFIKQQEEKERLATEEAKARAEKEHEEHINRFKSSINEFVTSNKDDYELINLYEQSELVWATIEQHFEKTQKVLSNKEASDLVEKYLESELERAAPTKKFQSKFSKPQDPEKAQAPVPQSKTLSNTVTSSAPSLLPAKNEQERLQRALAALSK